VNSNFTQMFPSAGGDDQGDEEESEQPAMPAWFGPPEDELGAVLPLGLVVGRSERGVVALPHATAYSSGVAFNVFALARGLSGAQSNRLFHDQHFVEEGAEPPEAFLRVGLELPGEARVSNLGGRMGRWRHLKPGEEPDEPVFFENGGGGGSSVGGRVTMRPAFWLWPLPEPGTIRVFCEWPAVDIPLSTVDIDGGDLVAAVKSITPLWPAQLA
jgi:hypothetical protein